MQPSVKDVDKLSCIPLIDAQIIELLKTELPVYLAKRADTGENLKWWKMNSQQLPTCAASAQKMLLVQPLAAFTLQDYLEASLMLQYNKVT